MADKADFAKLLLKHGYSGVKKIGEGSFGVAVLVQDSEGGRSVCKSVKVGAASMEDLLGAKKEARLLANLDHPNIVRYRTSFLDLGWFCIVMDFCDGGSLEDAMRSAIKKSKQLSEEQIIRWFTQAMLALEYLHVKSILHRDLKPSNLFLTKKGDLMLGDFGLSKVLDCTVACAKTLVGTPYYLSPEVIQDKPYTWPADIWSMGCILYEMCALKVPFDSKNLSVLAQKICFGPLPEIPSNYSSAIRELCFDLMNRETEERPSAEQVITRPLIQDVAKGLIERAHTEGSADNSKARNVISDQFRKLDLNGDGVVDKRELAHVLQHLDSGAWSDSMVTELLEAMDINGDGLIQLDEFLEWIFGSEDQVGLVERCQKNMEIAASSVSDEDITSLKATLLQWRQAVDIGCLSILPPSACVQTCETLTNLATEVHRLLIAKSEDDSLNETTFCDYFAAIEQMSAILHGVEQLLKDYTRQHVRRVRGLTDGGALKGLCFELSDGTRMGQCPTGLGDEGLAAGGTGNWEMLNDGEQILEVKGFALPASASGTASPAAGGSPTKPRSRFTLAGAAAKSKARGGERSAGRANTLSPAGVALAPESPGPSASEASADPGLAAHVTLCTSRGRELHFGGPQGSARGAPFSFKAPVGEEVEDAVFSGSSCTSLRTLAAAPIVVTWDFWDKRKVEKVQAAFRQAADAVISTLLNWSWHRGDKQGKYALLQARRLALPDPYVPDEVKEKQQNFFMGMSPPEYWDLSSMKAGTSVGIVELDSDVMEGLQEVVDATYVQRRVADSSRSLTPRGVQLVKVARIQNWQTWADYVAQQEIIRGDLAELSKRGKKLNTTIADLRTAGFAEPLQQPLDEEAHCVWLFHSISLEAVESVRSGSFDVDQAGEPGKTLYGRGIYLSECCSQVDEITPTPDRDGLRCMLLCRVILGNVLEDDALLPDVVRVLGRCVGGQCHSIQGNRDKHDPGALRDFVVYDKDQVYPEFMLWYTRVYD